ncbi:TPA: glycosyltransferase [Bacillus cereus]|nr:glycosyltransferase [Bacillus cereus]
MKILFLDKDSMWIHGLPNGFKDIGHEVKVSGTLTKEIMPIIIDEFCPDLIFSIGYTSEHTPQKQKWIHKFVRSSGIPHVYWATEDPGYTITCSIPFIKNVQPDFVFTICPSRVDFYKNLGIKAAHLDFGYHISTHSPSSPIEQYQCPIAVVANAYPKLFKKIPNHYRLISSINNLIIPLLQEKIPINFYGRGWDRMSTYLGTDISNDYIKGYLSYEETNKVYNSAKIIIGLQNHPTQLTQRTYEILGSGGFLLTNNTPAVKQVFTPNQDLIVSSSSKETLNLVQYYLENPDQRNKIREQGKQTVAKYSYSKRAEYIIKTLKNEGIFEGDTNYYNIESFEKAVNQLSKSEFYSPQNLNTLSKISKKFNIPIEKLLRSNRLF